MSTAANPQPPASASPSGASPAASVHAPGQGGAGGVQRQQPRRPHPQRKPRAQRVAQLKQADQQPQQRGGHAPRPAAAAAKNIWIKKLGTPIRALASSSRATAGLCSKKCTVARTCSRSRRGRLRSSVRASAACRAAWASVTVGSRRRQRGRAAQKAQPHVDQVKPGKGQHGGQPAGQPPQQRPGAFQPGAARLHGGVQVRCAFLRTGCRRSAPAACPRSGCRRAPNRPWRPSQSRNPRSKPISAPDTAAITPDSASVRLRPSRSAAMPLGISAIRLTTWNTPSARPICHRL